MCCVYADDSKSVEKECKIISSDKLVQKACKKVVKDVLKKGKDKLDSCQIPLRGHFWETENLEYIVLETKMLSPANSHYLVVSDSH